MPDLLPRLQNALTGSYRLERELGRGGMATVFLAQDLKHDRPVALKVLKPELAHALGPERFLREVRITSRLNHPHILALLDSGEASPVGPEQGEGPQSFLYYVMPYVDGESLRDRLEREKQLPLEDALQIAREVADALSYAHHHGVVHRDIKPENILLESGHAVVADFGIARAITAAGGDKLTETGLAIGTPAYMSPEQATGETAVDGRSDLYSLGCVLYEMLAGEPPFTGPTARAILARSLTESHRPLRAIREAIPQAVDQVVALALAKSPADRYPTAAQFLGALTPSALASTVPPSRPGTRMGRRVMTALAVAALGATVAWFVTRRPASGPHSASGKITAVAVLPFKEQGSNPDSSYLGNGMTDGLIADLAEVGSLKVISRTSGALAQGTARSLADLARELGVEAVVQGSIERIGDTVRVNVRFLRAPDSTLLLERDYKARLGALPDLQRELTTAITSSISAKLKGTERSRLDLRREVDQRAYDAYLRGRFLLEGGDLEQARTMFEQASKIAPDWAPPYVGLANYYAALPFSSDIAPAEVLPKARAALAQALALDDALAEAHAVNAYIRAYYEWDWRAAEQEFRRALELRPNYPDAYLSYGRFLASRRRLDEAIAQVGRAVELDPLEPSLQVNRALLYYFAGRYDDADRQLGEVLKHDSTDVLAKWGLALVAEQQGRLDKAIAILAPVTGSSPNRNATLGHIYAVAGKTAQARAVLVALHAAEAKQYVPSYWFALVHAGLGERDQALHYLERAYQERSTVLAYVLIDPRLASLRDHPRFLALARRLEGE